MFIRYSSGSGLLPRFFAASRARPAARVLLSGSRSHVLSTCAAQSPLSRTAPLSHRPRAAFVAALTAASNSHTAVSSSRHYRRSYSQIHDDTAADDMIETIDTSARLEALRTLMNEHRIDIYIVPSEDAHSSEYIAPCDGRRQYISGFSGSAGCAVVTLNKAALATDGRYFNQASKQLDSNWLLLKQGILDVPTWQEWVVAEAAGGKVVGVDPTLISNAAAKKLADNIKKSGGSGLKAISANLVDAVWGAAQPSRPAEPIVQLAGKFSGRSISAKLTELRKEFVKTNTAGFVVSMLDEVAWLFNLRGNDIPYNPVFFSYAIITADDALLYVDESKLTVESRSYLSENKVTVKPYSAIFSDATELATAAAAPAEAAAGEVAATALPKRFLLSSSASWALNLALGGEKSVEEVRSPIGDAKAVKNDSELEGMRQCHIRDGSALIAYFAWLEEQLLSGVELDEVTASDKLEELRSKQEHFVGLSFTTISSTGPNAAVIHYQPERGSCSILDPNAIYLCDSGAQYLDGTTDTTRTVHFGTPTDAEKKAYTLVLKGNIALDVAIFPKGTTGFALDALARQFLWKEGLDYRHGTGHGVGSYLNVHEGPIGIGTRKQYADVALASGNVTSIEPGYYEDGSYGIRIENMVIVKEVETTHSFGDKPYLGFEHVTMVPYSRSLIDTSLLTDQEKSWLNKHHAEIVEKTKGLLQNDERALAWLAKETQPI